VTRKGRGQKAEGRRQKAEGRRQKAEGRRQKAEGRRQKAEGRRQKAEGRGDAYSYGERYANDMEPTTERSKGIKPTVNKVKSSPFRRGLNPFRNGTFCPLPFAFCLLPFAFCLLQPSQPKWDQALDWVHN
jgi:hypothetical protein